jgi:hypothetical protein
MPSILEKADKVRDAKSIIDSIRSKEFCASGRYGSLKMRALQLIETPMVNRSYKRTAPHDEFKKGNLGTGHRYLSTSTSASSRPRT